MFMNKYIYNILDTNINKNGRQHSILKYLIYKTVKYVIENSRQSLKSLEIKINGTKVYKHTNIKSCINDWKLTANIRIIFV